jgi:hypothetical protein
MPRDRQFARTAHAPYDRPETCDLARKCRLAFQSRKFLRKIPYDRTVPYSIVPRSRPYNGQKGHSQLYEKTRTSHADGSLIFGCSDRFSPTEHSDVRSLSLGPVVLAQFL